MMKLGLDLDGVFANFNGAPPSTGPATTPLGHGMADLLIRTSGRDLLPRPFAPEVWHWYSAYGYKRSEWDAAWGTIHTSADFWSTLEPLPGAVEALRLLAKAQQKRKLQITWLTTRPGVTASWQSRDWLELYGFPAATICICPHSVSKGVMAGALELDAFVDDYSENIHAVGLHAPRCRRYLFAQPWNAAMTWGAGALLQRVEGHSALLETLDRQESIPTL